MSGDDPNLRSIFCEALDRPNARDRNAYLDAACRGNAELRAKIESLLAAHDDAEGFLEGDSERPALGPTVVPSHSAEIPGTMIGPYKLLEQIGEGGFGIVYMADQQAPVRRRVAVKIIKPGMDSKQVLTRFEAERHALAMMDHPNIARALDAGVTDSGRPYFVMELVRGVPITEYCDKNNLDVRQRLELFVTVCHSVQHAHQKGIIHRDIKPSNVLVTMNDGRPIPKVIDFGVAKAINQQLTQETIFTRFAEMIGTPLYMSPEQAEMSSLDIDTRSDIYSLGVLLYELLTGTTPFEKDRLKKAAFDEIRRIIREDEPEKPSTRISTLGATSASVSAHRHADPRRLSQVMRGDLDWIVMKALEKDRTRRYETANGLALDLLRHLADEPVLAGPPSALYRFRKFARRNKAAFAASAVIAAALFLGLAGTTWQAIRATDAEHVAQSRADSESRAREAEAEQRREAELQREQAVEQQKIAQQEELAARRNLYTARITLAEENLDKMETSFALALLEAERPAQNRKDLRGFEWYHLWWRCHQGHKLTLRGHTSSVRSVVFSPDGKMLASGSADGTVKLWDAVTGEVRMTVSREPALVNSVAFSPNGSTVAAGSTDGAVTLWDIASSKSIASFGAHRHSVRAIAYSPGGEFIASSDIEGTTKLWDIAAQKEHANITATEPVIGTQSLAFFPDGKTLAIAIWTGVRLCDVSTGEVRSTVSNDRMGILSIALSADAKTMASAGSEGVKLIDINTNQEQKLLKGFSGTASCVALSPDGKTMGVGTYHGTVELSDPTTGMKRVYGHFGSVHSIAFSPDGHTVASASTDGTVKLWDVSSQTLPSIQPIGRGHLWNAAFSPDGTTLALVGDSGTVKLWDMATMQEQADLPGHTAPVIGVAFAPDGKSLATCSDDATIRIWDQSTRQTLAILNGHIGPVYCVAFSPNGNTLASGSKDKTVKLWDVPRRQERAELRGHTDWIWAVAFSPDGKTLASGCDDSTIKLWDAASGQERLTLRGHKGTVRSVAFSHDGRTVFSTDHWTIRSWDAETGEKRGALRTIETMAPLTQVALFADGNNLAIGSHAALKFWDVATGRERATLHAHNAQISSVAISPSNRIVATASFDGSAKFWRTATEDDVLRQSSIRDVQQRIIVNSTKSALEYEKDHDGVPNSGTVQVPLKQTDK